MNINEEKIEYASSSPIDLQLCRLRHINPHYHDDSLELIYCLKGSIVLHAGFQHIHIGENQLVSVDCCDIHYLEAHCENLVLIIHIQLTKLDIGFDFLKNFYFTCEGYHLMPYQEEAMETIQNTLLSLAYDKYFALDGQPDYFQNANKILNILLEYFNFYTYEKDEAYYNQALYERFYRIISYCHEHYMDKITAAQLAKSESLNRNYFTQFMRNTTFGSFNNILKYIRCYQAERLLLTTEMPVAEISFASGFSDPKYFYSAFRQWWNCTPTEHRSRVSSFATSPDDAYCPPMGKCRAFIRDYMAEMMVKQSIL